MAAHSSILAWRIPWTKELGGLQSMRPQRVRRDGLTQQRQSHPLCRECSWSILCFAWHPKC